MKIKACGRERTRQKKWFGFLFSEIVVVTFSAIKKRRVGRSALECIQLRPESKATSADCDVVIHYA